MNDLLEESGIVLEVHASSHRYYQKLLMGNKFDCREYILTHWLKEGGNIIVMRGRMWHCDLMC
jgi:hypothetical protein